MLKSLSKAIATSKATQNIDITLEHNYYLINNLDGALMGKFKRI